MTSADSTLQGIRGRSGILRALDPRGLLNSSARLSTVVALITCAGLVAAVLAIAPEPARVEIDLETSSGSVVELFLNDLTRPPLVQPVEAGKRHRYVFDGIVEDISMLRLDPTDVSDASIRLHSITVATQSAILARFDARTLAGWAVSGLSRTADPDTFTLKSTTIDPILTTRVSIPLVRTGRGWAKWIPLVNGPDIAWRLAAMSSALLIVGASIDRARRLYGWLLAASTGLVIAVIAIVSRIPDAPGSAAVAVSRATVMGLSNRPAFVASTAIVLGTLLLVGLATVAGRRREPIELEGRARMKTWGAIASVLLIAVITAPDLESWAANISSRRYIPHWDGDNLLYWGYLIQQGRWPIRDFWYPYSGVALFELPFPAGLLLRWIYGVLLLGLFFAVIGRWRGAAAAVVGTAVLLTAQLFSLLPGAERYLLGPLVILSYAATRDDTPSSRVMFWAAFALAFLIEPPQLVYTAIPLALIFTARAAEHWRSSSRFFPWLMRRLRVDFGVPSVMVAFGLAFLAWSGQLEGFVEMYGRLGDAVAYSTSPSGLPELTLGAFPRILTLMVLSAVLIAIGTYEYLRDAPSRKYGEALFGVGLVTLMVMQKHFMRWMGDQLLVFAAISGIVLAVGWPGPRRKTDGVVWGIVLGAFVAMFAVKPGASTTIRTIVSSPARAAAIPRVLWTRDATVERANAARFAPERFEMYLLERKALETIRRDAGPLGDTRVFALTDEMAIYVLADQQSIWISNMYDASPLYRQERVVDWLRRESPPYVVFNLDHLMFDGFQLLVRVPLVFPEVISNYVPLETDGKMQVLKRRRPPDNVPMSYWRERLGQDVYVGRLASVSSFGDRECARVCGDLLEVRVPADGRRHVTVPFDVAGLPFSVIFTRVVGETTFRLLLDRVWFWNVAKRLGLSHSVSAGFDPSVSVRVRSVDMSLHALY